MFVIEIVPLHAVTFPKESSFNIEMPVIPRKGEVISMIGDQSYEEGIGYVYEIKSYLVERIKYNVRKTLIEYDCDVTLHVIRTE